MNKSEYSEYERKVKAFFETEGITNLSQSGSEEEPVCPICEEEVGFEPYFSWRACECCGSRLGGDRYHASGWNPKTKQAYCYEVCQDCLYYAEYGQLDDQTLLDIDSEGGE